MIEQDEEYEAYKKNLQSKVDALIPDKKTRDTIDGLYTQMTAPSMLQGLIVVYAESIEDFAGEISDKAIVAHVINAFIDELRGMIEPGESAGKSNDGGDGTE